MAPQSFIPQFFIKFPLQNKLNSPEPIQTPNSLEPENKQSIDILPEVLEETKNPKIITKNPGPYRGIVFKGKSDINKVKSQDGLYGLIFGGEPLGSVRCFIPTFCNHLPRPDTFNGCKSTIASLYPEFISADPMSGLVPTPGNVVWCGYLDRMNFDDPVYYNLVHKDLATIYTSSPGSIAGTATSTGNPQELDANGTTNAEVLNKVLNKFSPTPDIRQRGVDYYGGPERPTPDELIKSNINFVMRYIPYNNAGKGITKEELDSLLAAGLSVGFVWQRYGDEFLATQREVSELGIKLGDSFNAGVKMAQKAKAGMDSLGVPSNIPIYFAFEGAAADVDGNPGVAGSRDITIEEVPKLLQFLKGCESVVGKQRVGMYGGGPSMLKVAEASAATYYWQSRGWTREKTSSGQLSLYSFTNLLQYKAGSLYGKTVDFNIEINNGPSTLYKK